MTFETCRKGLDVLGKFDCVTGAIEIIIAIISLVAGAYCTTTGVEIAIAGGVSLLLISGIFLFQGVIALAEGFFCLRAVKDINKIMPAYIFSIVAFIGSCLSMISCIVANPGGASVAGALFACAINGAFLYFTSTLKKERELTRA